MAAGLQSGCTPLSIAATPATCGTAMDIPETIAYADTSSSFPTHVTGLLGAQAATSLPGARLSGLSMPGVTGYGPREEKYAT
ncbi:hypothetical protein QJS10_CPA08g00646 [Acorus calamus]|uniref:Uncharacterized protein n=1 Tax=Acorus calamus TaxID=4465 RepID=A0AAV9EB13_ACOCL|nr:hypothetical protein QJS10_CPA08g00646 [Acorus calamus]